MIGHRLGHYRILEKIGAGGMGVVYRALDERLERDVALKILPAGALADDVARKRLHREACALAKLNHPHIAVIHDFGTQEGVDFLVMEYLPGITLGEKLKESSFPEEETIRLGAQLAEGLAAAHEQGVVHRDLKPGNLRLASDGSLKILDFGLAKLLRADSDPDVTATLTAASDALGTAPYMAPEQLRGEPAGTRTDIWALGAVLYEMATGQRAFPENQRVRLIDAILHQAPQAPRIVNPRLSSGLEKIILRALEKRPQRRYQSAREVLADLKRLGANAPPSATSRPRRPSRRPPKSGAVRIRSLVVLPLENLMHDPDQDYFADGMTDALIAALAKISALLVISRTSSMQYKGARKPLRVIAEELHVDAVVEGSVLRVGEQVRITAQLIEARRDRHLWVESYDRELRDILALHGEVAQAIAREIQIKLTPQEQGRLAEARPVNPEAYQLYLRGLYYWNKRTEAGFKKGLEYFQQAIEKDPGFASAYVGLAESHGILAGYGFTRPREAFPKAKAAVRKALELQDTLAEAHSMLAVLTWEDDRDASVAEREFIRAFELNPGDATSHRLYAEFLAELGQFERAIAEGKRALELDPLSLITNSYLAFVFYVAREYGQAIERCKKAIELDPSFPLAHSTLGCAYLQEAMFGEAIAAFQQAASLSGDAPLHLASLAHAYGYAGQRDEARKRLEELQELSKRRYVSPYDIGVACIGVDARDQAFECLEQARQEGNYRVLYLRVSPLFDALRSDPRFTDLLLRVGFPPG